MEDGKTKNPVYVDRDGKEYYEGTTEHPFNVRTVTLVFESLEDEKLRMQGGEKSKTPPEGRVFRPIGRLCLDS